VEFHEVANIFPMMNEEEYEALKQDIKEHGLLEPIWTYQGRIIDGRNRYLACQELGIRPEYREWRGGGSLVSFVVSLNLKRRHLSASQKAVAALDALPYLEAEAQKRMLAGKRPGPEEIIPQGRTRAPQARDYAARIFDVNPHYVQDAKRLDKEEPFLLEQVRAGEITLPQAMRKVRRREVLERIEAKNKPLTALWESSVLSMQTRPGNTTFIFRYPAR